MRKLERLKEEKKETKTERKKYRKEGRKKEITLHFLNENFFWNF